MLAQRWHAVLLSNEKGDATFVTMEEVIYFFHMISNIKQVFYIIIFYGMLIKGLPIRYRRYRCANWPIKRFAQKTGLSLLSVKKYGGTNDKTKIKEEFL